jgi:hypothetical protein
MVPVVDERTVLRAPAHVIERPTSGYVALDPRRPALDRHRRARPADPHPLDGRTPLGDVVTAYAAQTRLDPTRAWLQVETFARDALRHGFVSPDGAVPVPYLGRAAYLGTDRLEELSIQVNDCCNRACAHCLVSSGPQRAQGLDTARLRDVIDQAVEFGVDRLSVTGGEPLARPEILELLTPSRRTGARSSS